MMSLTSGWIRTNTTTQYLAYPNYIYFIDKKLLYITITILLLGCIKNLLMLQ